MYNAFYLRKEQRYKKDAKKSIYGAKPYSPLTLARLARNAYPRHVTLLR